MPTYRVVYINPDGGKKRFRDLTASSSARLAERLEDRHPGITILKITERPSPPPAIAQPPTPAFEIFPNDSPDEEDDLPDSFWETAVMSPTEPDLSTAKTNAVPRNRLFRWGFIAGLILTLFIVFSEFSNLKGNTWYGIEGGAVNLDRVTLIRSSMSISVTFDDEARPRKTLVIGPITEATIDTLKTNLQTLFTRDTSGRISGRIAAASTSAKITFDGLEVNLGGFDENGISFANDMSLIRLAEAWLNEVDRVQSRLTQSISTRAFSDLSRIRSAN